MGIFKDKCGYLSEQFGDGGDSAVRTGLMAIVTGQPGRISDFVKDGVCVRNPWQTPWNNPKNFTKDQLKPLVAGLLASGRQDLILEIYENLKGKWFCPNSERDARGSTKLQIPHAFYKDSKRKTAGETDVIDVTTVPLWRKAELDQTEVIETKWFDSADPLLPNDWEFLKVAAGIKRPGGLGLWWHRESLAIHAGSTHNEENQMFSECYVLGTLEQYKRENSGWIVRSRKYWTDRNEIEYHDLMAAFIDSRVP